MKHTCPVLILPHIHRRRTGVTRSLEQLIPFLKRYMDVYIFGRGIASGLRNSNLVHVVSTIKRESESGRKIVWHANRNIEAIIALVLRKIFRTIHIVYTRHSDGMPSTVTCKILNSADVVISLTESVKKLLPMESVYIPHGVDAEHFSIKAVDIQANNIDIKQKIKIAVLGRVRFEKGQHTVIEALKEYLRDNSNVALLIIGKVKKDQFTYYTSLYDQVKEAGITSQVYFIDEVNDPRAFYKTLSLVVTSSYTEGFSMVPLEAMSMSIPVIATRNVGIHSSLIRHADNGWLYTAGDADELRSIITGIDFESDFYKALKKIVRDDIIRNWSVEKESSELVSLYDNL